MAFRCDFIDLAKFACISVTSIELHPPSLRFVGRTVTTIQSIGPEKLQIRPFIWRRFVNKRRQAVPWGYDRTRCEWAKLVVFEFNERDTRWPFSLQERSDGGCNSMVTSHLSELQMSVHCLVKRPITIFSWPKSFSSSLAHPSWTTSSLVHCRLTVDWASRPPFRLPSAASAPVPSLPYKLP